MQVTTMNVQIKQIAFFSLSIILLLVNSPVISVYSEEHTASDAILHYDKTGYPTIMIGNNLTGSVMGNVLHVNGTPLSNHPIELNQSDLTSYTITDIDGKYSFDHVALNGTHQVFLSYEGVGYSQEFSFLNASVTQLNFTVYDTTTSDEDIRITANHVVIQRNEGYLTVSENIYYENIGIEVFNNSQLNLRLPHEMRDFSSSIMEHCIQETEDGVIFHPMDPLIPGHIYRIWINYYLDVVTPEYMFTRAIDYRTNTFQLFVENMDDNPVSNATDVEYVGSVTIDDTRYMLFNGYALEGDGAISVTLAGLAFVSPVAYELAGALLLIFAPVILLSYTIVRRRRVNVTPGENVDVDSQPRVYDALLDKRARAQALLVTLQKLEAEYKRGLISQEGYEKISETVRNRRLRLEDELKHMDDKLGEND
jgi:hypothetical protein